MLAGGVASIVLMLGAATIVPAALMVPLERVLHDIAAAAKPAPATPPVERASSRN